MLVFAAFPLFAVMPNASAAPLVSFHGKSGAMEIRIGGAAFATYVWDDDAVSRPYFAQVRAPGGVQVTRSFPPHPELDRGNDDHATFHPGLWLAFGDINGADFWRLKARVRHQRFIGECEGGEGTGTFTVLNRYETTAGKTLCEERCRYAIRAAAWGFLLLSASEFSSAEGDFAFGDQEEMGLGVRLATGLTVEHGGGRIVNSEGGKNEAGTWGRKAKWCAGYGDLDGVRLGAIVMPDPANFRASWFHSRDYGLIVANPFGEKAMTAARDSSVPPDSTTVAKGERFRFGCGIGFFRGDTAEVPDFDAMYHDYLKCLSAK